MPSISLATFCVLFDRFSRITRRSYLSTTVGSYGASFLFVLCRLLYSFSIEGRWLPGRFFTGASNSGMRSSSVRMVRLSNCCSSQSLLIVCIIEQIGRRISSETSSRTTGCGCHRFCTPGTSCCSSCTSTHACMACTGSPGPPTGTTRRRSNSIVPRSRPCSFCTGMLRLCPTGKLRCYAADTVRFPRPLATVSAMY